MQPSIILIGHRTSGKSTLGSALAGVLGCAFHDIDTLIEQESGESADVLVTRDESAFRARERDVLDRVLRGHPSSVVAPGAGIDGIPAGHVVVWIYREGWEESARQLRRRLRPDLSPEEEFQWMKETREQRYRAAAQYRLHLERGCDEGEAVSRLVVIVRWLLAVRGSDAARTCWMVPLSAEQAERCAADVQLFSFAGMEIRSDRFDMPPESPVPFMASLRTADRGFFRRCAGASVFDCDVTLLEYMQLDGLTPRPLLLSAHPRDVFREYFMELLDAAGRVTERYPAWKDFLRFKYAPLVKSWVELRFAFQMVNFHQRSMPHFTFLPQGKSWWWMRALRLHAHNEFNYLSPGCETDPAGPPGVDYFLPLLTPPAPTEYHGIIGMPVDHSRGDVFHREASLREDGGKSAYVKIPVSPAELDNALHLLPTLGVRGLSVTSPLKRAVAASNFVGTTGSLESGNTLSLIKGSFLLYDTDEDGMRAVLRNITDAGADRGPVALFGSGGVAPAVLRALEAEGWGPVTTISARDGWGEHGGASFALVVDASGPNSASRTHPPQAAAWIDLHYRELDPPPPGVRHYRDGSLFFTVQARRQREIWAKGDAMLDPAS